MKNTNQITSHNFESISNNNTVYGRGNHVENTIPKRQLYITCLDINLPEYKGFIQDDQGLINKQ